MKSVCSFYYHFQLFWHLIFQVQLRVHVTCWALSHLGQVVNDRTHALLRVAVLDQTDDLPNLLTQLQYLLFLRLRNEALLDFPYPFPHFFHLLFHLSFTRFLFFLGQGRASFVKFNELLRVETTSAKALCRF